MTKLALRHSHFGREKQKFPASLLKQQAFITGASKRAWLNTGSALHGSIRVRPAGSAKVSDLVAIGSRLIANGRLAKTDRVDAALLAKMGALLELRADQPKSETLHDLKQLATARLALIKDRTATTHVLPSQQIKRRLKQIERDLSQVTEAIDAIVAADKDLAARAEILTSIPGIAKVTACAILTEMPELGHLSGKKAAALAGLAPISRQSGKWQGKERIQGGRASVRRAVYLPAVVATRFNPDMKAKYEHLISTGKCKKLAITAVMRKLIVTANALLRDQRKWGEYPA
jgi:transposase